MPVTAGVGRPEFGGDTGARLDAPRSSATPLAFCNSMGRPAVGDRGGHGGQNDNQPGDAQAYHRPIERDACVLDPADRARVARGESGDCDARRPAATRTDRSDHTEEAVGRVVVGRTPQRA